jgi:hypothetical protein
MVRRCTRIDMLDRDLCENNSEIDLLIFSLLAIYKSMVCLDYASVVRTLHANVLRVIYAGGAACRELPRAWADWRVLIRVWSCNRARGFDGQRAAVRVRQIRKHRHLGEAAHHPR